MRKFLTPLCVLLTSAFALVSCLGDNEMEVTGLHDDCAITSFSIQTAQLYIHTTSSKGEDSVYVINGNSMADYKFSIDHAAGLIYNADSLPMNVNAARLICSYSTKNSGTVYIQNMENDTIRFFSMADSTDFSKERVLHVYSSDFTAMRKYTVKVNVHKQDGDAFTWKHHADHGDIAALKAVKTYVLGDKQIVLGSDGTATRMYTAALSEAQTWTSADVALGQEAWSNAVVKNDTLFVLDGTTLRISTDAATFAEQAQTDGISRLLGGCSSELYALSAAGSILVSADGGKTWRDDTLDDDKTLLPTMDIASTYTTFKYGDDAEIVVLVGNRNITNYLNDRGAVVWRKIVEKGRAAKWAYMGSTDEDNIYLLPRMTGISAFYYDGALLACGGPLAGSTATINTQFYQSRDGGITWKKASLYVFPEVFNGNATSLAAAVDKENNIRLVAGGTGQIWSGRLTRLGWAE